MKTLIAFVLIVCAGCGAGVSEQEKLAKRLNDKMDREERTQRIERLSRIEELKLQNKIMERAQANRRRTAAETTSTIIRNLKKLEDIDE